MKTLFWISHQKLSFKSLFLFTAFVVVCMLGRSASAAEYTVTTIADQYSTGESCLTSDVPGNGGNDSNTDCSLREAIYLANQSSGDHTVTIPEGTYTFTLTDVGGSGESHIEIDNDFGVDTGTITLQGAGQDLTIIDADDLGRHILLNENSQLSINDLALRNGYVLEFGGAIYADTESSLTIDSVILEDNISEGLTEAGGAHALFVLSEVFRMTDSIVRDNGRVESDFGRTGAVLTFYSGDSGEHLIERTIFERNISGIGAAISHFNSVTPLVINESIFRENVSYGDGGGAVYAMDLMDADTEQAPVIIRNSTLNDNTTTGDGGAVFVEGFTLIENTTLIDNVAQGNGGAVAVSSDDWSVLALVSSSVVRNYADSGGGLHMSSGGDGNTASILGSVIAANFEGDPSEPPEDFTMNDCSENGKIMVMDYTYLGSTLDCGDAVALGTGNNSSGSMNSVYYTAPLVDAGGFVPVQKAWGEGVSLDVIPESECVTVFDFESGPIPNTRDARGNTRPDNGACDFGAYERDQTAPVITLDGESEIEVELGSSYEDAGATAEDGFEGSVEVVAVSTVDTSAIGEYTVTYTAEDSEENEATPVVRTVTVVAAEADEEDESNDDSVADTDDVDDAVEDAAPNGGDANNDGILDSQQSNVASFRNAENAEYVSLVVNDICSLADVSSRRVSDVAADEVYRYPTGLTGFTANCGAPGSTISVSQYYYSEISVDYVLRKLLNGEFATITDSIIEPLTIDNQEVWRVTYSVTDGGDLDADGVENGVIVDPVGLAVEINVAEENLVVESPEEEAPIESGDSIVPNTGLRRESMMIYLLALASGLGIVVGSSERVRRRVYAIISRK